MFRGELRFFLVLVLGKVKHVSAHGAALGSYLMTFGPVHTHTHWKSNDIQCPKLTISSSFLCLHSTSVLTGSDTHILTDSLSHTQTHTRAHTHRVSLADMLILLQCITVSAKGIMTLFPSYSDCHGKAFHWILWLIPLPDLELGLKLYLCVSESLCMCVFF